MKIYLASGNEHKKLEVSSILKGYEIVIPKDEGITFDADENGSTFLENALIKAKALYNIVKAPVLADDSGLCVDALGGKPGIFSARYGGENDADGKKGAILTSEEKCEALLIHLSHAENKSRAAHFVCACVLYSGEDDFVTVSGRMDGEIVKEQGRGNGGFGYDPIFYLPLLKRSAAELSLEEKNKVSHRGKAFRTIESVLRSI